MQGRFTNEIGDLGELIAAVKLSTPVKKGYNRPLFKPIALGGKYPAADFLVDILNNKGHSAGYFLVQVKGKSGLSARARRVSASVSRKKLNRLARMPLPTYLVGVDIDNDRAYIVCANTEVLGNITGISKDYDLSKEGVRIKLYDEVRDAWKPNLKKLKVSNSKLST